MISTVTDQLTHDIIASSGDYAKIAELLKGRRQMTGVKAVFQAYPSLEPQFDQILGDLKLNLKDQMDKASMIFNFFTKRLTKCPVCGKVIVKGQSACSPEHLELIPQRKNTGKQLAKEVVYFSPETIKQTVTEHLDGLGIAYTVHNSGIFIESRKLLVKIDSSDSTGDLLELTEKCSKLGVTVFHIFEFDRLDIWLSMIDNKLGLNQRVFARNCQIKEVSNLEALDFLDRNHIQGKSNGSVRLGLYQGDRLLSLMTFSKARFTKHFEWELVRFCTLRGYTVVGAASKLFQHFLRVYQPKSCTSYANRRFSQGNLYKVLGFDLIQISKPNYQYVKDQKVYSRVHFQKHRLVSMPEYRPDLTEVEIMERSGYKRIFDCGNFVFGYVASI